MGYLKGFLVTLPSSSIANRMARSSTEYSGGTKRNQHDQKREKPAPSTDGTCSTL